MVKFYCTDCGYSFSPRNKDKEVVPSSCPYCNKKDTLQKEKTSSELLTEFSTD